MWVQGTQAVAQGGGVECEGSAPEGEGGEAWTAVGMGWDECRWDDCDARRVS